MKRRRLGILWAAIGLLWSMTAIFIVIPYYRGEASDTLTRYEWLGANLPEMLGTLLTRPGYVIAHQFSDLNRLHFLVKLLLPVGFLALLSPATLAVGLPALAYNLMSDEPSQSSIYFQYVSPVIPFVFLAAILGASWLLKRLPRRIGSRRTGMLVAGLLGLGITLAWVLDNPFTKSIDEPYFSVYALEQYSDINSFTEARRLIPPDESVATMMGYGPHLSLRPELYLFYDRIRLGEREFGFPQADYLLLNLTDLRWGVNARFFYAAIETAIGRYGYEAIYFNNDVALLARASEARSETGAVLQRTIELTEAGGKYAPSAQATLDWMGRQWVERELPESAVPQLVEFETGISLLGYERPKDLVAPGRPLCATLYWQPEETLPVDYTVFVHFVDESGYVHAQRDNIPALGFHPTTNWLPGEIVGDMHCFQVPSRLPSGNYGLMVGLYEPASGQRLQIVTDGQRSNLDAVRLSGFEVELTG